MEKCKNLISVFKTVKNLLLQNYSTEFLDIAQNSPWVCPFEVCLNGGAISIIGKIIAKDHLNIVNLMQNF